MTDRGLMRAGLNLLKHSRQDFEKFIAQKNSFCPVENESIPKIARDGGVRLDLSSPMLVEQEKGTVCLNDTQMSDFDADLDYENSECKPAPSNSKCFPESGGALHKICDLQVKIKKLKMETTLKVDGEGGRSVFPGTRMNVRLSGKRGREVLAKVRVCVNPRASDLSQMMHIDSEQSKIQVPDGAIKMWPKALLSPSQKRSAHHKFIQSEFQSLRQQEKENPKRFWAQQEQSLRQNYDLPERKIPALMNKMKNSFRAQNWGKKQASLKGVLVQKRYRRLQGLLAEWERQPTKFMRRQLKLLRKDPEYANLPSYEDQDEDGIPQVTKMSMNLLGKMKKIRVPRGRTVSKQELNARLRSFFDQNPKLLKVMPELKEIKQDLEWGYLESNVHLPMMSSIRKRGVAHVRRLEDPLYEKMVKSNQIHREMVPAAKASKDFLIKVGETQVPKLVEQRLSSWLFNRESMIAEGLRESTEYLKGGFSIHVPKCREYVKARTRGGTLSKDDIVGCAAIEKREKLRNAQRKDVDRIAKRKGQRATKRECKRLWGRHNKIMSLDTKIIRPGKNKNLLLTNQNAPKEEMVAALNKVNGLSRAIKNNSLHLAVTEKEGIDQFKAGQCEVPASEDKGQDYDIAFDVDREFSLKWVNSILGEGFDLVRSRDGFLLCTSEKDVSQCAKKDLIRFKKPPRIEFFKGGRVAVDEKVDKKKFKKKAACKGTLYGFGDEGFSCSNEDKAVVAPSKKYVDIPPSYKIIIPEYSGKATHKGFVPVKYSGTTSAYFLPVSDGRGGVTGKVLHVESKVHGELERGLFRSLLGSQRRDISREVSQGWREKLQQKFSEGGEDLGYNLNFQGTKVDPKNDKVTFLFNLPGKPKKLPCNLPSL